MARAFPVVSICETPTADDEALARQLAASFEEEGSAAPPPYEAAAPAALSDEELARRLHEELNG